MQLETGRTEDDESTTNNMDHVVIMVCFYSFITYTNLFPFFFSFITMTWRMMNDMDHIIMFLFIYYLYQPFPFFFSDLSNIVMSHNYVGDCLVFVLITQFRIGNLAKSSQSDDLGSTVNHPLLPTTNHGAYQCQWLGKEGQTKHRSLYGHFIACY